MLKKHVAGVTLMALLGGCTTSPAPSPYDLFADNFGPAGNTPCERFAYETGRQRFEFQSGYSGLAWAARNANLAADVAFERCASGRGI